jgi:hypothetical protein
VLCSEKAFPHPNPLPHGRGRSVASPSLSGSSFETPLTRLLRMRGECSKLEVQAEGGVAIAGASAIVISSMANSNENPPA